MYHELYVDSGNGMCVRVHVIAGAFGVLRSDRSYFARSFLVSFRDLGND